MPGFTLIELMITVAVIGILAMIAIPKFAELTRKARDAKTLGGLGAIRSALAIYVADNEGEFPWDLPSIVPKYMDDFPYTATTWHPPTNTVI
jgi:prepilin-type N-terminal cleavage/methylation domain-containing protein